jgi:hypothetical protein
LQPRRDHGVVEQPAETVLGDDVPLHLKSERIAVRHHAVEGEEPSGHPEPRVAQHAAERGQAAQRQRRRSDQDVRVQHPHQRDVHEEPFWCIFRFGDIPVHQVAARDARLEFSARPTGRNWYRAHNAPHGLR